METEVITTYINAEGVLREWKHSELTEETRAIFKAEKPDDYKRIFEQDNETR